MSDTAARLKAWRWVLDKLEALPKKKLAGGEYWNNALNCGCAVGALFPEAALATSRDSQATRLLDLEQTSPVLKAIETAGADFAEPDLAVEIMAKLQHRNDGCVAGWTENADARYELVVQWVRDQIHELERKANEEGA